MNFKKKSIKFNTFFVMTPVEVLFTVMYLNGMFCKTHRAFGDCGCATGKGLPLELVAQIFGLYISRRWHEDKQKAYLNAVKAFFVSTLPPEMEFVFLLALKTTRTVPSLETLRYIVLCDERGLFLEYSMYLKNKPLDWFSLSLPCISISWAAYFLSLPEQFPQHEKKELMRKICKTGDTKLTGLFLCYCYLPSIDDLKSSLEKQISYFRLLFLSLPESKRFGFSDRLMFHIIRKGYSFDFAEIIRDYGKITLNFRMGGTVLLELVLNVVKGHHAIGFFKILLGLGHSPRKIKKLGKLLSTYNPLIAGGLVREMALKNPDTGNFPVTLEHVVCMVNNDELYLVSCVLEWDFSMKDILKHRFHSKKKSLSTDMLTLISL